MLILWVTLTVVCVCDALRIALVSSFSCWAQPRDLEESARFNVLDRAADEAGFARMSQDLS